MFCPKCGSTQGDEMNFCKACGANLNAVRQVVDSRETEKLAWDDTWLAEMFMSAQTKKLRKLERERRQGITPEMKRYMEIKAGVITACVGIATSILLFVLMGGLIRSGEVTPAEAEILARVWVVGLLPLLVGIGLIINGVLVSRKLVEAAKRNRESENKLEQVTPEPLTLPSANAADFIPSNFSVTEETTKHLKTPRRS